jgi:RNA polymerase sigma factor (sigma-70 family)
VTQPERIEHLLRELAPQVLGLLARRHARFDAAEDAVQEALLAAAVQWRESGVPGNPRGWLIAVAERRLIDELRSDQARRRREDATAQQERHDDAASADAYDDSLPLLFLCCHPALTPASQIALTLRAFGGLTTAQIAAAFFVPEAAMTRRITRAKQTIRDSGLRFEMPSPDAFSERLGVVLQVLYLVFNEGYTASSGSRLQRTELADEAIRLARILQRALPDDPEVSGLLALMLLTHSRRAARTLPDGSLVPLADQDRTLWDTAAIEEGIALVTAALASGPLGPYQLQAAIAAVHAEAKLPEDTDWPQILALYELLVRLAPSPIFELGRVVALAMVHGPEVALKKLGELEAGGKLAPPHRVEAVRAHLLEMAGADAAARLVYERAATLTTSLPERRYLEGRSSALSACASSSSSTADA